MTPENRKLQYALVATAIEQALAQPEKLALGEKSLLSSYMLALKLAIAAMEESGIK